MNPPRADVQPGELYLRYELLPNEQERVEAEYTRELDRIEAYLDWARNDAIQHNNRLRDQVPAALEARKSKLLKNAGLVNSLGLPIRRRGEEPTYSPPEIRRKTRVFRPPPPDSGRAAEPALPDSEYDHILEVIERLTIAIERSPRAFSRMAEEQLRDHILVQLNGHYEGQATGETFSSKGKTDIFVRVEGKHVFIAECKFWKGPAGYRKTIEQLMGYTCWSDTKAAIVLFNKNRDHTAVLEKIRKETDQHPKLKKELRHRSEMHLRYVFEHPEDPRRSLYVAILAMNLPAADSGS